MTLEFLILEISLHSVYKNVTEKFLYIIEVTLLRHMLKHQLECVSMCAMHHSQRLCKDWTSRSVFKVHHK